MWTVNSRVISQTVVPDELLGRYRAASRLVDWRTAPLLLQSPPYSRSLAALASHSDSSPSSALFSWFRFFA
jgi:hypothetical protein